MMSKFSIVDCLQKREYGYNGFKKNVNDIYIEHLGYAPRRNIQNTTIDIGNTFACKFSRYKSNLHIIGCSSEHGDVVIQNTMNDLGSPNNQFDRNRLHNNAVFNIAWSDSAMKLVTACGDQTSKLCTFSSSGTLVKEREYIYGSSVKSVMFCPESSAIFCGSCMNSSVKIWDARSNNSNRVLQFDHHIPNTHGMYSSNIKKCNSTKVYPASSVIFKNDHTIITCSSMDESIKLWDLRKSYRQVHGGMEPIPLLKYNIGLEGRKSRFRGDIGYVDMVINTQSTHLYASATDQVIYCYSLDSDLLNPICGYSGYLPETYYSRISISNDGRYLFSGCLYNSGVVWSTDSPYNEKPMFIMERGPETIHEELSASDWCLDSNYLKLATSSDSLPKIWSIISPENDEYVEYKFSKSVGYKSKLYSKTMCTVPIKLTSELREYYNKESEKNLENWDLEEQNIASNIKTISKSPWEDLFLKKCSQTSQLKNTTSINNSLDTSKTVLEVTSPLPSRKRKKSIPQKSLIDQYLIPNNSKEKKLDSEK